MIADKMTVEKIVAEKCLKMTIDILASDKMTVDEIIWSL